MSYMSGKLLFILPALPDFVPYVYNYFKIAEECGKEFDVICWNRRGDKVVLSPQNYYVYDHPTSDDYSRIRKLCEIYKFSLYVRRIVRNHNYQIVCTYTIADSVLFAGWLPRCFRDHYIFDIRDYSPMIDNKLTRWLVVRLLKYSALNVISSKGFMHWLPKGFDYTVCHNTDIEKAKLSMDNFVQYGHNETLKVLTIGALRNTDTNQEVIKALSNKKGIQIDFVGDGGASPYLKQYCEINNVRNVSFHGRYRKEEEDEFVRQSDIMNIILPHDSVSDYLMSNRFYLSVRMRKPMIVNDGSFQAEQVRKYDLGLVIAKESDLYKEIINYWNELNWIKYNDNCKCFIKDIIKELDDFNDRVKSIIQI